MASKNKQKRGRQESSSSDEETLTGYASRIPINNWPEFILIQPDGEKQLTSNPFMTAKVIQGIAEEVKAIKNLRNGDILVHCALRSHALTLLKLKALAGIPCKVSPHRYLNSSKGIIRDRERCLQSMSEETLTKELADQGVIHVKRFTVKTSAGVSNTNTYLMTFSCASLPQAIKAGYHNIKVEVYVPNPLRCYMCQRYGHGAMRCTNGHICHRCGGNDHEGSDCKETPFCCNCKECPIWIRETAICKLMVSNNISFPEARKLYFSQNKPTSATANSYAAAAKAPQSVASVACQTNLTWIDSSIPMQRPSLTLSTKSITTKTNSSCQTTPISAFSQPSSDVHSQSAAKTASSLIKSTSKTSKSSKPSQPSTSRSKSSSSTSKSSSSPSQRSKVKTYKPAKVQSGRPHKGEDDPIKSYNRFLSLEEMEFDKTLPTSRPVSVSLRRGRRMSPLKHPS